MDRTSAQPQVSLSLLGSNSRRKLFLRVIFLVFLFMYTGIGGRFSQTISNLGHTALLRGNELPL
jgi:hypothetical protein